MRGRRGEGGDPDCIVHAHPNLETRGMTKKKEEDKRIATDKFLKTISDLWFPNIDLGKPHSQISTKYLKN